MGDTVRMIVTEEWAVIPGLVLDARYNFQNITMQGMYLRQQATLPNADDTGMELMSFVTATLEKEANDIYVRMQTGKGIAYYNQIA